MGDFELSESQKERAGKYGENCGGGGILTGLGSVCTCSDSIVVAGEVKKRMGEKIELGIGEEAFVAVPRASFLRQKSRFERLVLHLPEHVTYCLAAILKRHWHQIVHPCA